MKIMCLRVSYKKFVSNEKILFCILKVTEERSRFRSWLVRGMDPGIRIRTKMSQIFPTRLKSSVVDRHHFYAYPDPDLTSHFSC